MRKSAILGNNRDVPPFLAEKCRFCPILPDFYQKWRGIAVFAQNCTFSQIPTRPLAELQKYVGFFENSSIGPQTRSFSAGFGGKIAEKGGNGDKKGGKKILVPPNLLPLLDAKFDVDYDSAIKHDLVLIFDKIMGVQS